MKKEIIFTASSVAAALLVKKMCELLSKTNNSQYKGKKRYAPYNLLDPFVLAYDDSRDFGKKFREIITKKMTIDEVKELKIVLELRQKALDMEHIGYAYKRLLKIIEEVLPIENSIEERFSKEAKR
uniref:hypothetical protein n=1 Tax=Enterococcus faecalis TaxID=1351 RepID=UPI000420A593|nr:hypothetical protein [Enterococcus faecalis]